VSVPGLDGTVTDFDPDAGLGVVTGDDEGSYPFHCTQIADGSRSIGVGARVRFQLSAGRDGHWEATDLWPVPAGPA
jgi:CspA family cold shock protein